MMHIQTITVHLMKPCDLAERLASAHSLDRTSVFHSFLLKHIWGKFCQEQSDSKLKCNHRQLGVLDVSDYVSRLVHRPNLTRLSLALAYPSKEAKSLILLHLMLSERLTESVALSSERLRLKTFA